MRILSKPYWMERGMVPRWQLLGIYVVILAVTISGMVEARRVSNRADHRAAIAINASLHSEKICSETNRGACKALFERLHAALTDDQWFRLSCSVLAALDRDSVRVLASRSGCPVTAKRAVPFKAAP